MDYKKCYDQLVQRAKNRKTINEYAESHHIIPKSHGGSDDESNLVKLTAREHFIAHLMLVKIHPNSLAMVKAAMFMCTYSFTNEYRMNNRRYGWLREKFSKRISESQTGEGNSQFGTVWVTNFKEKKSFKVKKTDLDSILENNNIKQIRVIKFDKYDDYGNLKKLEKSNKKRDKTKLKKVKLKKVWISNLDKRISIKVLESDLNEYLKQGFINKRILNFNKYFDKMRNHKTVSDLRNEKKQKAERYFYKFLNGNYDSVTSFVEDEFGKKDTTSIRYLWVTYIDGYKEFLKESKSNTNNSINSKRVKEKFG